MELDDHVCLCFRVSQRKLVNFMARERPSHASQLSQCGGAGTGCGWCIPILQLLHRGETSRLEALSAEEHASKRQGYLKAGKQRPASGQDADENSANPAPDAAS